MRKQTVILQAIVLAASFSHYVHQEAYAHDKYVETDCGMLTQDATSAISMNDSNMARDVLSNPLSKCLFPEYITRLHNVIKVNTGEIGAIRESKVIDVQGMKSICAATYLMQNSKDVPAAQWVQVNSITFTADGMYCSIHYQDNQTWAELDIELPQ